MTVIVWTPSAMAADRQSTRGDTRYFLRKLHRIGNEVVGFTGCSDFAIALLRWLEGDRNPATWPEWQKHDDYAIALLASGGRCFTYDRSPFPVELLQPFAAIGSGREAAFGALHMGATAVQAVQAACAWIDGCGGEIDVERLT